MILCIDSDAAFQVSEGAKSRAGGYHYLTNKEGSLFNAPIEVLTTTIKPVMASAAEAEMGALFLNAQSAIPLRHCLEELGHPQPATSLKTDNLTALGFAQSTIKQKRSRTFDRQFWWLKDRSAQQQFHITWGPGKSNLADYYTKHHTGTHHKQVRPIYLHESTTPTSLQGCIKVFRGSNKEVRAYSNNTTTKVQEAYAPEVQKKVLRSTTQVPTKNTQRKRSSHLYIPSHPFPHKNQYLKLLKFYCASLNKKTQYMP